MEKNFAEYSIDALHSVFIPVEDAVLPGRGIAAAGAGAALFWDKVYTVVDRRNASFRSVSGKEVIEKFREALLGQTAGSREQTRDRNLTREQDARKQDAPTQTPWVPGSQDTAAGRSSRPDTVGELTKATVKHAESHGVVLNGVPGVKSLDSPPVKTR